MFAFVGGFVRAFTLPFALSLFLPLSLALPFPLSCSSLGKEPAHESKWGEKHRSKIRFQANMVSEQ